MSRSGNTHNKATALPRATGLWPAVRLQCVAISFCAALISEANVAGGTTDSARAVSSGRDAVVYLAPATEPYEALPLGNGHLGVMVRNAPGVNYIFNHRRFFANAEQDNALISAGEFSENERIVLRWSEQWSLDEFGKLKADHE